ncbi:nicotinate-nucleotide adenylyltransferase [bacterium]|nr:nicotinate-nucleotide adenylyltransferase [bacterium]
MDNVGLMGGTFNPIHLGHLLAAKEAKEKFGLTRVIFIPSYLPPHKEDKDLISAKHRFNMTSVALDGREGFSISDIEIKRGGKSYAIDTIREFRKIYGPKTDFYFIVGVDAINEIDTWKDFDQLIKICRFIGVARPGSELCLVQEYLKAVSLLNVRTLPISSTEIREKIRKGMPINDLVPRKVAEYIFKHRLYQK